MDHRYQQVVAGVCAMALLLGRAASAQTLAGDPASGRLETRAGLESAARAAEREHRTSEARLLRERLVHGDFEEGDKIVVSVEIPGLSHGDSRGAAPVGGEDTAVVRAGKVLQFTKVPGVPAVSLEGVLRSELVDTLTSHLGKYLRHPVVHAIPLLRIAVMGAVGHPGWYSTPSDVVLADVLMQAGGVSAESDVENTVIRRAGNVIWPANDVRQALADGLSLDRLQLRAGDEIFVGTKRQWWGMATTIQIVSSVVAVYVAARAMRR